VNRVFVVLLALVAAPGVASVAQDRPAFDPHSLKPPSGSRPISGSDNPGLGHDAAHCAMREALHPGATINKCPVADPPPPPQPPPPPPPPPPAPSPTCGSAPAGGGTVSINGQVYVDASPWPGLAGWCVQLSGPVSGSATTDASGNYVFTGLPAGTYTVCEVVQANWHETYPAGGPSCPGGFGYSMTLIDGSGASFIDFANLSP
jgi:Prealbumin-like fold domain